MAELLSVADALSRVLADAQPLPAVEVPLAEAHGRVLAADLAARRTQPPAAVSAMDGYAVRGSDIAQIPARLKVIGEVPAGKPFDRRKGDPRVIGCSRPRGDQDLFRIHLGFDLIRGHFVIADDLHLCAKFTEVLDKVICKRIVVVDH